MFKISPKVAKSKEELEALCQHLPPRYYADLARIDLQDRRKTGEKVPEPDPITAGQQAQLTALYKEVEGLRLTDQHFKGVDVITAAGLIQDLIKKQEYRRDHPEKFSQ